MAPPEHESIVRRTALHHLLAIAFAMAAGLGIARLAGLPLTEGVALFAALGGTIAALALAFFCIDRFAKTIDRYHRALTDHHMVAARLGKDLLTDYLNRVAFKELLDRTARGVEDGEDGLVMIVFFDLNRFKSVNDTFGHEVGDALLIEVAHRASETIETPYAMARLGGDEFAALVPWRRAEQPAEVGTELVAALARPFHIDHRRIEIGTSVGIAVGDLGMLDGETLLRRADLAMYEAKRIGDTGFKVYDDILENRQLRETSIRKELEHEKFGSRFELHYQPILDARTGRIGKAEALLRAKSDPLVGISPAHMVTVAENSGQIVELTDWTIDTAIAASRALGITVALNLSPVYFRHADFAERLIDKLYSAGGRPENLLIEITESVLISDLKKARTSIDTLRDIGIQVYLDDFGTGFSSLSYLQNFDLDGLKLDRSFLYQLSAHERAKLILRSMIDFGHSLGMEVVIEGIESEWQVRMLQLMGCDYLQGFELGLPMPQEELAKVLRDASNGVPATSLVVEQG